MKRQDAILHLAHLAYAGYSAAPATQKLELLDAIAIAAPGTPIGEQAKHTAFMMRKAEESQMQLDQLFQ